MHQAQPPKAPIARIRFPFSENRRIRTHVTYTTLDDANRALKHAAWSAPDDGSYDKTDVEIVWGVPRPPGEALPDYIRPSATPGTWESIYVAKIDLQRAHAMAPNPIGRHVHEFCGWYSGRVVPYHKTAEWWAAYLKDIGCDLARYAYVLDALDLGDVPLLDDRAQPYAHTAQALRSLLNDDKHSLLTLYGLPTNEGS